MVVYLLANEFLVVNHLVFHLTGVLHVRRSQEYFPSKTPAMHRYGGRKPDKMPGYNP